MYRVAILVLVLARYGIQPSTWPQLQIDSPPELAGIRTRFESIDARQWSDITGLVGLPDAGGPIRVVLATESSNMARDVSPWISGFAVEALSLVVVFPSRSPTYPDDTLEDVLRHEIAHVLIGRAAAGQRIPRWFDEGLAMEAERERRFSDQTQLLYQLATGSQASLMDLDRLFSGGQNDQIRAYAIAGALVHDLRQTYGADVGAQILKRIREGASFEAAFLSATGVTPDKLESEFWKRQRIWTTWVPIITSSTVLWPAITLLALLAIYMRHRKNRAIEKRWEEEDDGEL
jgi:hypothetical protein